MDKRQNEQPTTDGFDRMFLLSTGFGHTMTFFKMKLRYKTQETLFKTEIQ